MKVIWLTLLCVLAYAAAGQEVHLSSQKLPLPAGDVIGVAFDEPEDQFVVQQSVLSTENNGLVIRSSRLISSWSISKMSSLAKRDFGLSPRSVSTHPCGRVASVTKQHWLILCSAGSVLEVLDSRTLATDHTIGPRTGQYIYDFVVDEQREKVFVAALQSDRSVRLISYSLSDGSLLDETAIASTHAGGQTLALEPKSGQIILSDIYTQGHREGSHIYSCGLVLPLSCMAPIDVEPISQMDFLGRQFLFATRRNSGNDKSECINSLSLDGTAASPEYCSKSTGVRYAMGVVLGQFIVGFTGTSKDHAWREERTSVQSSFSVWRTEDRHIATTLRDPTDYGPSQHEMRIEASRTKPLFLTYNWVSNVVYLYTITESN